MYGDGSFFDDTRQRSLMSMMAADPARSGTDSATDEREHCPAVLPSEEGMMLYYALVFLIVAVVAGVLGASGVAAMATQIAYVLFAIAIVLFLVHFISGRRTIA